MPIQTEDIVNLCKLLSDRTRVEIVRYLAEMGEANVGQICEHIKHGQPATSHHLALLRVAHVVQDRREGKHNYYSVIDPDGLLETL